MKYLRLILGLSLVAFIAHPISASADLVDPDKSVRILVAKSDEVTAKVTLGTQTYLAPIRFEDSSFSWNDVKDGYSITPAFASLIEQGRVSIYIGCSGATFSVIPAKPKKKS